MERAVICHAYKRVNLAGKQLGVKQDVVALVEEAEVINLSISTRDLDKDGLGREEVIV